MRFFGLSWRWFGLALWWSAVVRVLAVGCVVSILCCSALQVLLVPLFFLSASAFALSAIEHLVAVLPPSASYTAFACGQLGRVLGV